MLASLSTNYLQSDYNSLNTSLTAAIWLSIICLSFEVLSLFAGFTLFRTSLSVFYSLLHFIGTILVSWFILDSWNALSYWYLFIFFRYAHCSDLSPESLFTFTFPLFTFQSHSRPRRARSNRTNSSVQSRTILEELSLSHLESHIFLYSVHFVATKVPTTQIH